MSVAPHVLDGLAADSGVAAAGAFDAAGWTWQRNFQGTEPYTPSAAHLAVAIRRIMEDVGLGHRQGTGRIRIDRYLDECGDETFQVLLELGTVHADADGGS